MIQLKELYSFLENEDKKFLQHGNTCFLSIIPAIDRILEIYERLKSHLISQVHYLGLIKQFLDKINVLNQL